VSLDVPRLDFAKTPRRPPKAEQPARRAENSLIAQTVPRVFPLRLLPPAASSAEA